jgi:hypothetical protein
VTDTGTAGFGPPFSFALAWLLALLLLAPALRAAATGARETGDSSLSRPR